MEQIVGQSGVSARKCGARNWCVLGDGSTRRIRDAVTVDIELRTAQGPLTLHAGDLFVLPGMASELLVGRSELDRLNLPDLPPRKLVGHDT